MNKFFSRLITKLNMTQKPEMKYVSEFVEGETCGMCITRCHRVSTGNYSKPNVIIQQVVSWHKAPMEVGKYPRESTRQIQEVMTVYQLMQLTSLFLLVTIYLSSCINWKTLSTKDDS